MDFNGSTELWELIGGVVSEAGLTLFDLEAPRNAQGVFRIFIAKDSSGKAPVGIEDCVRVSKRLSQREDFETLFPGSTLEVSSPGLNRKLRRSEHFAGAIGERIRLISAAGENPGPISGTLRGFDGRILVLDQEGGATLSLDLAQVRDARVEFLFT